MKTTLILRDDLVRRAKARAALRGQALSRYVEESLERSLQEDEAEPHTVGQWIEKLPAVSEESVKELNGILDSEEFRSIDREMWQ